jgi:quercetin dioxygenase-like cupin family protein
MRTIPASRLAESGVISGRIASHFSKQGGAARTIIDGMTYGIVQLRELDDQALAGGFGELLEARFARQALGCERVGVSLQRIKPGVRGPVAHRHETDEEVYVVVAGGGRAVVEGEVVELRPWTALRLPPRSARGFEAGPDGLELLAFGTHTEGDRGEMVDPGWPS